MKIGIISDIHEDAERLLSAIKSLEKYNCDYLVCLGDISGFDERFYSFKYSKNLDYCVDIIKVNCRVVLPGNHDLFHLKKLPEYNTVFHFPDNWYELDFKERKSLSNGLIWLYDKDYPIRNIYKFSTLFEDFINKYIIENEEIKILLTHSVAPDISGFLTKKPVKLNDFINHFQFLENNNCKIGISGHLHPNGLLRITGKKVNHPKFALMEISEDTKSQFIIPCIADGIQDNGFTILDTKSKTIESIPLRTPKHSGFFL
ncbi:MAG: metallophosphoesterase [Candidatus Kapabacteria bacterium]|nr:metallophosphoesterase [Ignavibacteriota bacterium]MCW5884728.1 metallophosphoesterase [Candidatus Kapabacteria bacterium]